MRVHSHYSGSLFDRARLTERRDDLASELGVIMRQTDADCLFVTGKSGIAMAFTLLAEYSVPIITVRKPDERSHGVVFEGPTNFEPKRYLILDDFVSSGDTVERVLSQVHAWCRQEIASKPKCVGVIEWDRAPGWGRGSTRNFTIYDGWGKNQNEGEVDRVELPIFQTARRD